VGLRLNRWLTTLVLCWWFSNYILWYGILSANVWDWDWDKHFITSQFPADMPQIPKLGFVPRNPVASELAAVRLEWERSPGYPFYVKSNDCTTLGMGVYKVKNKDEFMHATQGQWNTQGMLLQRLGKGKSIFAVNYEHDTMTGAKGVMNIAYINQTITADPAYKGKPEYSAFIQYNPTEHPKLCAIFDKITDHIPGMHVGRFDLVAKSEKEFLAGKFTIIEMNGQASDVWRETSQGTRIMFKGHNIVIGLRNMLALRAYNPISMARIMFMAFYRAMFCDCSEFQWTPSSSS